MDDGFKELIDLYFEDDNDEEDDDQDMKEDNIMDIMYNKQSKKIKCLLSLYDLYKRAKSFEDWQTFNVNSENNLLWVIDPKQDQWRTTDYKLTVFHLYMIQTKPMDKTRDIRVRIKFERQYSWIATEHVGTPFYVWINKNDTLQYIINKYIKKTKRYILQCYRLRKNIDGKEEQRKVIPKLKWHNYKLDNKFDWKRDILLFRMKHPLCCYYGPEMHYPVFKETIHDDFDGINDIDIEIEDNQIEIPELYDSSCSNSPTPPPSKYFHKPQPKKPVSLPPPPIPDYDDESSDFDDYFPGFYPPFFGFF